jgi:ubiquitin C-terminal hydrolase
MKSQVKYSGGRSGIANLGNTCYMNSTLQCLSNTIPLRDYFLSKEYQEDINKRKHEWNICREFYRVLNALWQDDHIIEPKTFKTIIGQFQHQFMGFRQHDSHEFFIHLIDLLHKGICYKPIINIRGVPQTDTDKMAVIASESWKKSHEKEYSKIIDIFYGQYHAQTKCTKCETISNTFDPFSCLELEIKDRSRNLFECLSAFTGSEALDEENKYDCVKCGEKTICERKIVFWKTPDILVITLKRFIGMMKNNALIDFPIRNLDISPFVNGYDKKRSTYDLYGVSNHSGGCMGGHYYSYCLNSIDNRWYEFNDTSVEEMSEGSIVSNTAYVLYYRRKT